MQTLRLGWGIAWRIFILGGGGGAGFGCLYGMLSMATLALLQWMGFGPGGGTNTPGMVFGWLILGAFAGAMLGGLLGAALGLIDGLVLSIATVLTVGFRANTRYYREFIGMFSVIISSFGAFTGSVISQLPIQLADHWGIIGWVLWSGLPTVLAAAWGWWISGYTASWVLREIQL